MTWILNWEKTDISTFQARIQHNSRVQQITNVLEQSKCNTGVRVAAGLFVAYQCVVNRSRSAVPRERIVFYSFTATNQAFA